MNRECLDIGEVGGGLRFSDPQGRGAFPVGVPRDFEAPVRLDNSGYMPAPEEQGANPWCAAFTMDEALQASAWRRYNRRINFREDLTYYGAKAIDGLKGDGTTLEAVIAVAQTTDLSDGAVPIPKIRAHYIASAEDVVFAAHRYGLVMLGLMITNGWRRLANDGKIGDDNTAIGGHAVLQSGYDLDVDEVWGPNWWKREWGVAGYWRMRRVQLARQFRMGYALEIIWPEDGA